VKRAIDQLIRELRSDHRKLAAVIVLLSFGMLLWGRLLLQNVPQTATARPERAVSAVLMSDKNASVTAPARPETVIYVDLPAESPRDLFGASGEAGGGLGFTQISEVAGKSRPDDADMPSRPDVLGRASGLRLQSVLVGPHPRAVIDGVVLEPGQQVQGFTLVGVSRREALLERDGYLIRLRM
jgi:hypothetical protein